MAIASAPLPVAPTLALPEHWRAIDFISDIHLTAAMPRTFDAWMGHLLHTDADAVLVLGDLFEVWVGDDARTRPFERLCLDALGLAARQRPIWVMVGNRDFLLGAQALAESGVQALADPTVLRAWGNSALLTHGDAWCLDDHDYQRFRDMVRSAGWQQDFLARPLDERLAIAAHIRSESEHRKQAVTEPAAWADVDPAEALRWLQATGAEDLIHGHTHRPGSSPLATGHLRHVLSDWDLDGDLPRAEVLRLTPAGFERRAPCLEP